jgi:phosphatidylglycerol---prolipoprotein diacylglyceryl transferase
LPAHARDSLVRDQRLQTSTGFTLVPRDRIGMAADPRSVVRAVERGSAAEAADLKPGDRIIKVNGQLNSAVVEVNGTPEKVADALKVFEAEGAMVSEYGPERPGRAYFDDLEKYSKAVQTVRLDMSVSLFETDRLGEQARDWPRGKHEIELVVERDGQEVTLRPFVPRSVGLYPTQLYETVSMILLIFLLLAFYPFRRHDGQLLVMCMMGYAVHRFINESIRIEPSVGLGLTLSQWGSVVIFAMAAAIELYLWRVMPSRWQRAAGVPTPTPPGKPAI